MVLQESGEMYLETIWVLSQKRASVRSVDVAEELAYSRPSVSRAMRVLRQGGYIVMDTDGNITLTDIGRQVAAHIYERHTLLTSFLRSLGVTEATAAEDACRMEHYISAETFQAIKRYMGE
ncbi:MAG: metal-dependent transcriptional regulator [Oscillibacter sp.]|nr:metal-dependent transcriptional regulator [Oscillibacter sp.]